MNSVTYREVGPFGSDRDQQRRQPPPGIPMEFCKRAMEAVSLDALGYILTNDFRVLVPFDRCSLVIHLGGSSRILAISGQPILDKKTDFYSHLKELFPFFKEIGGLVAIQRDPAPHVMVGELNKEALDAWTGFMEESKSAVLVLLPIHAGNQLVGHLVIEFMDRVSPNAAALENLTKLSPFMGAALSHKWLLSKKPQLKYLIAVDSKDLQVELRRKAKYLVPIVILAIFLVIMVFYVPFFETVGGEAQIVPGKRYAAYCMIEGIIEQTDVKEGDQVSTGKILATFDPRDLDYKIRKAQSDFQVLTEQLVLLQGTLKDDPSKLAEIKLTELKRKSAWLDLGYYKWQKQFLQIKAPTDGIIITKEIETLKGKKFMAGDPFCELAAPNDLWAEVYVSEDQIGSVKVGQTLRFYLNNDPLRSHEIKVEEIAPAAEANERFGNVYRVRGLFPASQGVVMLGMKGIGKIDTNEKTLWTMFNERIGKLWNRLSLHF